MASSPIADLTYRNYDGPLEPPINRWWAIAKMSMRMSIKKKGFWIWSAFTALWYVILLIIFYFADASSSAVAQLGKQNPFFASIVWKDMFLNAFSVAQLFFFILALLIGVGTIANDNRANALLVYLSKPCSKLDYVIGKWLGIFVPMTLVAAAPTLLFYLNCLLGYRSYGFLTQDPWLIVKLLGMVLIPGFFHASVALGVSSLFQQGRLAGATYSGIYFFSWFLSKAMQAIWQNSGGDAPAIVKNLYYCSFDGIQIALAKIILHTDGGQLIPGAGNGLARMAVPAASALIFVPAFFLICAFSMLVAWSRIRAVEVVGS
jgi:ABC-2 type transport system permease protein